MIKKIKVFDLDGTCIDSMHRFRANEKTGKIDLAHWRDNDTPEKIMLDSFLPLADVVRRDLANPEIFVVFATARACAPGDSNYKFLHKHDFVPNHFIHRQGVEDTRGGAELKISGLNKLLNLKQFKGAIIHIYEDNLTYLQKMVDYYYHKGRPVVGHYIPSQQGI